MQNPRRMIEKVNDFHWMERSYFQNDLIRIENERGDQKGIPHRIEMTTGMVTIWTGDMLLALIMCGLGICRQAFMGEMTCLHHKVVLSRKLLNGHRGMGPQTDTGEENSHEQDP